MVASLLSLSSGWKCQTCCALLLALSSIAKALLWSTCHKTAARFSVETRSQPWSHASVRRTLAQLKTPRRRVWVFSKPKQRNDFEPSDSDRSQSEARNVEVVSTGEEEEELAGDVLDWIPDRIKAKARRLENRIPSVLETTPGSNSDQPSAKGRPSAYTEEEEEIIASMGGKATKASRREIGYLGDSTLREIAMDYSVPVCYLADVLCMWGVLPPIPIDDVPLGDMVTGEQAFAILEAVNSLEMGALNDRYSNTNLRQLCFEYDIDLQDAFSMAMKEGWSLPFGVETCLRVNQEDELLRVLRHEGSQMTTDNLDNGDDENYEFGDAY